MFCVKCGKEVKEGTKFCTNCGAEMEPAAKDDKLTYSQNKTIETTSNPTPVVNSTTTSTSVKDGKATASIVLGIVSLIVWCVSPITSIIGLILGICSKKSGKKVAGIILNAIALGFSIIGLILLFGLGYFTALVEEIDSTTPTTTPGIIIPSKPIVTNGQKITFDNFELTFSNNYSIIKDEKESSEHYNEDVIKLPVTIKNLKDSRDHLNMYYYEYYAPNGEEIESVRYDFGSRYDAIDYVYLDGGESKLQYFYILYKGDGKYKIKFSRYDTATQGKEEKQIEFTIKK